MGKQATGLRLRRGPRTAAVLTFAVPGKATASVSHPDSRHRGWTFARPPAQTSLRRCAVASRLAKARIAADKPGREVATWLLMPRQMVVLYALLDARRTGQARRLQLVDTNEVEIAECGP
jgi:hypothetical protein